MKIPRNPLFVFIAVAGIAAVGANMADARTWTQAGTGKKIEADFVRLDGDQVILMVGGRSAQVPLDKLSEEDQAFVKKAVASATAGGSTGGGTGGTDWPQWRGADRSNISPDTGFMEDWPSEGPEKTWVFEDAGMGYSSFSIVGGKLFTLGTRSDELYAICVDTETGEEVWSTRFGEDDQEGYKTGWGHGPRSTPTFSGGKIYVLGPKGTLACLDAASGKEEWSKNLVEDFSGQAGGWGFAESPLIDGDKVVVAPGGNSAGIVALDKKTGRAIWEAGDVQAGKAEYGSIVPAEINGKRQYIRLFQSELVSVDAESGELLWQSDWPGKTAVIPTPIVDGNEIYITSGYGAGSKLVAISEDNEVSEVWANKVMKNHHGGVVKFGDYLYGFSDGGGLICQDWKTGEMVWNEKGGGKLIKGAVHGVAENLVCLNEGDGTVTLVEAGSGGFKQLGQFQIDPQSDNRSPQGKIWTHPVVVGGKLFLRDQEYLICYDVKG